MLKMLVFANCLYLINNLIVEHEKVLIFYQQQIYCYCFLVVYVACYSVRDCNKVSQHKSFVGINFFFFLKIAFHSILQSVHNYQFHNILISLLVKTLPLAFFLLLKCTAFLVFCVNFAVGYENYFSQYSELALFFTSTVKLQYFHLLREIFLQ